MTITINAGNDVVIFYFMLIKLDITCESSDANKALYAHPWAEGGGTGGLDPPPLLKNYQNIGFLSILVRTPEKKPAFNFGPLSAHQRNTI